MTIISCNAKCIVKWLTVNTMYILLLRWCVTLYISSVTITDYNLVNEIKFTINLTVPFHPKTVEFYCMRQSKKLLIVRNYLTVEAYVKCFAINNHGNHKTCILTNILIIFWWIDFEYLHWLGNMFCKGSIVYTLNKSSKWYIMFICRVFRKGLNADIFYIYFDFQCIIKMHDFSFVHFKSSCQYQFTGKTMTSRAKWRLNPK